MGFTRVQLEEHYGREVPDLLPDPLRLLFVGINPSLRSAATGAHFSGPGNRFYPVLHRAGITGHLIRAANGFSDDDLAELTSRGHGPGGRADSRAAAHGPGQAHRDRRRAPPGRRGRRRDHRLPSRLRAAQGGHR